MSSENYRVVTRPGRGGPRKREFLWRSLHSHFDQSLRPHTICMLYDICMPESTELPLRRVPPLRVVRQADVSRAADALLRAGERPTVEKIRAAIGSGSPNTVGPLLDAWWKHLAARLDSGPAALHRLPETVAHVAEALWMQALDEGRRRAQLELRSTQRASAEQQQNLEVRSHVLTLREGELDARLHERERTISELNLQLRELTLLLRKEQAMRQAHSLRMRALEEQLTAKRTPLVPERSKRPTNRRTLRDKRATRPQHLATRKARKKKGAEKATRRGRR